MAEKSIYEILKDKYFPRDGEFCSWDSFLNAIHEAREYGYQEAKEHHAKKYI